MGKKPLIHKFRTKLYFYIYDANSNRILRVDPIIYEIIDFYGVIPDSEIIEKFKSKYTEEVITKRLNLVKSFRKQGYFSDFRPTVMEYPLNKQEIKKQLDSGLEHIILNVTEQCNMRCKYCVYSGTYYYERTHSERNMSFNIARKALDFFFAHNKDSKEPVVTFYGGEPFLNFKLIKDCVNYVKKIAGHRNVTFTITTNGTLLTNQIIDFLSENKIELAVSLDGSRDIHNRYRVFPDNKGTYDIIISNLRKLKERAPDYYNSSVFFSVTVAPPYNLLAIDKYFNSDELVKGHTQIINFVDEQYTSFFDHFDKKEIESLKKENIRKFREIFKQRIIENVPDEFMKTFFQRDMLLVHKRFKGKLGDKIPLNGCCLPGKRRLFVSLDGKFYMCEKMDEHISIGDCDKGIDIDVVFRLLNRYSQLSLEDCRNCWALRICDACMVSAKKDNDLDLETKRKFCKIQKDSLHSALVLYTSIREQNPSAFDYLKEVKIN